jgi:hypothetical protein
MSRYVRISDEKDARWHAIRHQIAMDRLREREHRDQLARQRSRPDVCPQCGNTLDACQRKPQAKP